MAKARTEAKELTDNESEALRIIRENCRLVSTITVRELAEALGYSGVGTAQSLIVALEEKGHISRERRGVIEVASP